MSWSQVSATLYRNSEFNWVIEQISGAWWFKPSEGYAIELSVNDVISILSSATFASDPLQTLSAVNALIAAETIVGAPPGIISAYAGGTAPSGWLECDGGAVSRATYAALFAAISTVYGPGNGTTTFNVPDLRGIQPRGTDSHGTLLYANGGVVTGPAQGAYFNDSVQGHFHTLQAYTSAAGYVQANELAQHQGVAPAATVTAPASPVQAPSTDGVNGAPRTGAETRGFSLGVKYIIKT